jgi:hypothetical protein
MKKYILILLALTIVSRLNSQTVVNNIPDTVIRLIQRDMKVESYCKIKIDNDIVLLDIIPLDKNDSLEMYLYRNSNRIIKLPKKDLKVIAYEDFILVSKKSKSGTTKKSKSEQFTNDHYLLYKFKTSGEFIGTYRYQ